jgi:hypothetical protein
MLVKCQKVNIISLISTYEESMANETVDKIGVRIGKSCPLPNMATTKSYTILYKINNTL